MVHVQPRISVSVVELEPRTTLPVAATRRANGDAAAAAVKNGAIVVVGDVFALLKLHILVDGHEGLRHLADGDDRSAVRVDLGGDELLGAVGERDHHDDRRHADNDAEQREDGAQFTAPQRLEREFDGFTE